jgi:hypothetical protein
MLPLLFIALLSDEPRYIDLANRKDLQTIIDREPGQYLGHPTTVLLEDGRTIIIVYPKGHGKGAIVMKRSTDGGRTWSQRLPTPKSWETSKETPTIHRTVDRAGKKRLILFSGLYPIRMAHSEDNGMTWSELQPIGDFGGIVAMSSVERLANGDYMALFHDDGRYFKKDGKATKPPVFTVYKTLSKDGGLTWSSPVVVVSQPPLHLCEPGLVRSPDGKEIAVLLRENSRKSNSHVIFSNDEGQTWSNPDLLLQELKGDRHVGKYLKDGRLFVTFRGMGTGYGTDGDWVAWLGTYEQLRSGANGKFFFRLMDNHNKFDCAYPGVEILPDGTIFTATYGHWTIGEKPYIVGIHLKPSDIK